MLSPKNLLIKCITLLTLEQRDDVSVSPSVDLIGKVLELIPIPENIIDHDSGRQTFLDLRSSLLWLIEKDVNNFPSKIEISQNLKVVCKEDTYLFDAYEMIVNQEFQDVKDVVKTIQSIRNLLNEYLNEQKIESILKDYSHKVFFKKGQGSVSTLMKQMGDELEPYVKARATSKHPAMVGSVDLDDIASVQEQMTQAKQRLSTEGSIRTGWQAFNRQLTPAGGFRRGEFYLASGLQHNFKSGWLMSTFVHACLFNEPFLKDQAKRPLLYFITLENSLAENLIWMYQYIRENIEDRVINPSDVSIEEASQYVATHLRSKGWEVKIDHFDPSDFNVYDLLGRLDELQAEGYEIAGLWVDYLNLINKSGIQATVAGDDIRLLVRRVRNYTNARSITLVSAHQMSSEANNLAREGVEDLVKVVANRNYYDGCRRLGQEPDSEGFMHLVTVGDTKYFTFASGKRRYSVIPEQDKYFCIPFNKSHGTLKWDVDKEDSSVKKPGGPSVLSAEESPDWYQ